MSLYRAFCALVARVAARSQALAFLLYWSVVGGLIIFFAGTVVYWPMKWIGAYDAHDCGCAVCPAEDAE